MSTVHDVPSFETPLNSLESMDAVDRVVRQAVSGGASDLFVLAEENAVRVSARIMGRVERIALVAREQGRQLINVFKTQAGIDIAERRRPQEGRWIFEDNGNRLDLRISVVPTLFGEDLAIRILD